MASHYHFRQALQSGWRRTFDRLLYKTAEPVTNPLPKMLIPAQWDTVFPGPCLQPDGIHEHIIVPVGVGIMQGKIIVLVFLIHETIARKYLICAIDRSLGKQKQHSRFIAYIAVGLIADLVINITEISVHQRSRLSWDIPAVNQILQGKDFLTPSKLRRTGIIWLVIFVHNQAFAATTAEFRIFL